jgi:hypothetical protein
MDRIEPRYSLMCRIADEHTNMLCLLEWVKMSLHEMQKPDMGLIETKQNCKQLEEMIKKRLG